MLLVGAVGFAMMLFVLGFHVGKQLGETAHIRQHLAQTRLRRQTIPAQRIE